MNEYTIPVLHPLLVHFPLALLVAAAPIAVVWALRRTTFWRDAALLLLALGALGALAAYLTGEAMEEQSEGVPIVDRFVEQHETLALWTLGLAAAAMLAFAALSWYERQGSKAGGALRWAAALLAVAAAALVAWTAHLGGLMVWGVPV